MENSLLPSTNDFTDTGTLVGLERGHRDGLIAVCVFAGVSLVTSTALFLHLTRKLVLWHLADRRRRRSEKQRIKRLNAQSPGVDLSLGLPPQHFQRRTRPMTVEDTEDMRDGTGTRSGDAKSMEPVHREPNQFVVLLYNLLLADIKQSVAFFLNAVWVARDSIVVGSGTCWTQAFFLSTGDLAGSLFIAAIAVHTYLVAIRGWKPSQRALILTCSSIWIFNYLLVFIGFAATNKVNVGFFGRATTWCWITREHEEIRLFTHYLYVFICLALTTIIYTWIFLHLRRTRRKEAAANARKSSTPTTTSDGRDPDTDSRRDPTFSNNAKNNITMHTHGDGYNSAFLIYPLIYVVCTAPLAIGRIATMARANLPVTYFCAAGALISLNGFLDTVLWGLTRREVVFGDVDGSAGADGLGLESFSFMRTPHNRKYGNMIWIEAGADKSKDNDMRDGSSRRGPSGSFWSGILGGDGRSGRRDGRGAQRSVSQQSLRGAAGLSRGETLGGIQMDMVTTVVVEVDPDRIADDSPRKGSGLSISPEDYISSVGPRVSSDLHRSGGSASSGVSAQSGARSEKDLHMNMDILNRI
ncbi:hypothetical protein MCOR02_008038 [Pyricularia oryzae]|nr:uncharacterized protein MGG_06257 [Pyricularia oryzae 70-15]ELQ34704.1 hypothetical protein OOU_Y34scaffold00748g23 [Pyricularia oryzae Y34]KAH9430705.1 hypothetical protein MCOR02_008038 [Pyricularia oryzae]EHA51016.1 hypothetical protein MGG_06257 [Pyricularia oryzae 70-15]KAI6263624.1 hypothetical protein MCOR19_000260 [Pyricularia oryzae]KAI6272030.1 hypothetical protein MCOR26_007519 [Pyricularia oryzae]